MYIFIDESGIHKPSGKSAVALVYIEVENLDKLNNAIVETEKFLRIDAFHWNKQIWKIRKLFLERLSGEDFLVKAALLRNPFIEMDFHKAVINLVANEKIKQIIIDGKKSRRYHLLLKQFFRKNGMLVKKVKTANDLSFPGLRVADLFAGLIRAYYEEPLKKEAQQLYEMARNKITTLIRGGQNFG
ncbi:MAG: DUF3800 domain-containing protein [Patescibacteria group bacterium]|jgi:hypothetical protein